MPPATARQLLTHMKWNVDRLIEGYYGGEADDIFSKGGIADPRNPNSAMVRVPTDLHLCDRLGENRISQIPFSTTQAVLKPLNTL